VFYNSQGHFYHALNFKEIETWMESSGEHGVVLFTMGFIFNPQVVPKKLVNSFMEAFGRLPQKFLVKFEGPIEYVPPNVKVLEWIPQQDVLGKPRVKYCIYLCELETSTDDHVIKLQLTQRPEYF